MSTTDPSKAESIQLPSVEVLEATHQFPLDFTFKIIGDSHPEFVSDVLNHAVAAIGPARTVEHSVRQSASGKHTSVTLKARCHTAHEVQGIYTELLKITGLRALF